MKKMALALALCLLLAGCAGEGEQPLSVGLCLFDARQQTGEALILALQDRGYRVSVLDAGGDQARQDRQLEALMEKGVDLVILEPVMPSGIQRQILQLQETGIPVVFINRQPPETLLSGWQAAYVGFAPPGRFQGEIPLPQKGDLNGDDRVAYLVIQGPEDNLLAQQTTEGCALALGKKGDNLAVYTGDWSRESGKRLCKKALSRYGDKLEVIFCGNDAMALGALEAAEEKGVVPGKDLYFVGLGGEAEAVEQVRLGKLAGTVRYSERILIRTVLSTSRELLERKTPGPMVYVQPDLVTPETTEPPL